MDTLDETLGYDADHSDDYCIHGTWIGSWWGPDYLCGYCEDGVSLEEYEEIVASRRANWGIMTTTITTDTGSSTFEQHGVWRKAVPDTYVGEGFTITNTWRPYDAS